MLVGREVLLAAGDVAVTAAAEGHGRLLLLAGEAGIGKSSLAEAIADRGRAVGAVVRVGACWETEGLPAFTPWLGALGRPAGGPTADVAERLVGGEDAVTDAASAARARARLFAEVVAALDAASAEHPQVIVLEDLHWADAPSLELLAAVAPHLRSMAMLIVGTFRDDEMPRPNPLGALGGAAERITVEGLDAAAVAEILAAVTGRAQGGADAAALRDRTGGNPLFVTQMARLLDAGSAALPSGVQDVLERRLARVSSDTVRVLGAAAVLGHELDQDVLAAVVGDDVLPALDEARAARLVEPCDGDPMRWRFVHALVQATRYATLATAEREAWHRAAIDALRSRPSTTAAELAHHASRAHFATDDTTAAELHVAAGHEALARLAWADATAAFERALTAAPDTDAGAAVRAEAWLGIGGARLRQDRPDVRDAFDQATALAATLGRTDLLARAALGFGVGLGAFEVHLLDHRQIEVLEGAAAALADTDPMLPLVLARLSVALAFVGSPERRGELADRAVELARAAGEPVALGHALAARCDARSGPEHVAERLAAAGEIVVLAQRASDLPLELLGRRLLVVARLESLDLAKVDGEITAYAAAADSLGDPIYSWYASLWRALRAWNRGEAAEADRLLAEAEAVGAEGGSLNSAVLGHVARFMMALDRRDRAEAEAEMTAMLAVLPNLLNEYVWLTTGLQATRLDDVDGARAASARVTVDGIDALPRDSEWFPSLTQLATLAWFLDDHDAAAYARTELARTPDLGGVEGIGAYLHGSAHRYLALVAAVAGDATATRAHVDAAARAVAGGGALLEALTALDGARALERIGEPEDLARAAELSSRARATCADLGFAALAAQDPSPSGADSSAPAAAPVSTHKSAPPTLQRDGDTWAAVWDGTTVRVKHAKGVADLAVLLERPGREVHVRELDGHPAVTAASSAQPVLDDTAVQQYRQRLADLEDDLDEADRHGDTGRATRLTIERDALVDELTKAFGLAGRGRRLGSDPDERLRKAVSARVKASIDRLEELHPALGRHLRASVRTGFFCTYDPEQPVTWTVVR